MPMIEALIGAPEDADLMVAGTCAVTEAVEPSSSAVPSITGRTVYTVSPAVNGTSANLFSESSNLSSAYSRNNFYLISILYFIF